MTAVVLVDWGTSHLRLWPVDAGGTIQTMRRSDHGMGITERDAFSKVLEVELTAMDVDAQTPVIMCGMVGSRQGWREAPYVAVPAKLADVANNAVAFMHGQRKIVILPGIADKSPQMPDVMRSEETQLLGMSAIGALSHDTLVCMPGSHSKWVRIKVGGGEPSVTGFATSLSGELLAAVTQHTVLRHCLGDDGRLQNVDAENHVFRQAMRASMAEPATILMRLFSARPRSLLHAQTAVDAAAWLSGTIIGQDIAGALARFGPIRAVALVGGGAQGPLYAAGLALAGIELVTHDGDDLAVAGLLHTARTQWPERFAAEREFKMVSP